MTVPRRRVTIVQRVIRPYRLPFFEELRTELADRLVDLSVVYSALPRERDPRRDVAELPWAQTTNFRQIAFRGRTLLWQEAPRSIWGSELVVVEQATRMLLNYRLLLRRHRRGPKVAFWGHGDSPYPDADRASETLKRWVSRKPDWWFAYTDGVSDRVRGFGFPPERITSVHNATDTRGMAARVAAVSDGNLARVRDQMGLLGGTVGLFVGALIPEKQLGFLVEASDVIRSEIPDFELVIAGDGLLAPWVIDQAARRPWMHYVGQRFGDDLAAMMKLSSMLLIPEWVGLVITDGFAAGRPLFSSGSAPHGPEIEYLRHGQNGLLFQTEGDPRRYAAGVVAALREPGLLMRLQQGCRDDAHRYSVEDMATRFADGIVQALDAAPRRRSELRPRASAR